MKRKSNEGIDYALSANRWALISSGLWSRLETTKSFCTMGTLAFFTMNLLNGLTGIPQFVDLYLIWGNSYDMFENMKCSLVLIFMQFKGIVIWTKMTQVGFLLREIYADWEREALNSDNLLDQDLSKRRDVMMSFAKTGRIISYIMTATMYGAAIFFLPTRYIKTIIFNVTLEERGFPYETEYLTNLVKYSPYYEMIYLSQMIGGTLCVTTNFAVDSTVAVVTVHICGQFKILANDWNKLIDSFEKRKNDEWTRERNAEVTKATLKKLVQRHLHLIGLADVIEETFSAIVLLQLIVSSFVISLIGFYFIQAVEDTDVLGFTIGLCYLTSQTLFIFVYCFSGQELYNQGVGIADAIYMSSWYNLPPDISKCLMFVQMRCYKPLSITAGKFCVMDYTMFMTVSLHSVSSFLICFLAISTSADVLMQFPPKPGTLAHSFTVYYIFVAIIRSKV